MKCQGNIKKGKKVLKCYKRCVFLYCKEHWKDKLDIRPKFYKNLSLAHKRIVWVVSGLLLSYTVYKEVTDYTAPCGKKDHISGMILPISPQSTTQYHLDLGAKIDFPIETVELEKGFLVTSLPAMYCANIAPITHIPDFANTISPLDLMLKIIGDELYISVTIKDFDGYVIGRIKDNKWEIKPNNITDCSDGKDHFEILDKAGNVVFGLEVDKAAVIHLRGYFIKDNCAIYLNDGGADLVNEKNKVVFDSTKNSNIKKNKIKYCKFYSNSD